MTTAAPTLLPPTSQPNWNTPITIRVIYLAIEKPLSLMRRMNEHISWVHRPFYRVKWPDYKWWISYWFQSGLDYFGSYFHLYAFKCWFETNHIGPVYLLHCLCGSTIYYLPPRRMPGPWGLELLQRPHLSVCPSVRHV